MRWWLSALLLSLVGGCGGSADPAPAGPALVPSGVPLPAAPTVNYRWFDAAAEQELHAEFGEQHEDVSYGPGYEKRLAARKKYANQLWRFKARMTSLWAAQRNTFDQLVITVEMPGIQPFFVRLSSQPEKDKLIVGNEYLFEGRVVEYTKGLTRNFEASVVTDSTGGTRLTSAPGPNPVAPQGSETDQRTAWHYVNAPLLFPGQTVTEGTFRKQGPIWMEERKNGPPQDWKETTRTLEYVELSRPLGDFFVRLYNDRSTYRRASQTDWTPMFPGNWE